MTLRQSILSSFSTPAWCHLSDCQKLSQFILRAIPSLLSCTHAFLVHATASASTDTTNTLAPSSAIRTTTVATTTTSTTAHIPTEASCKPWCSRTKAWSTRCKWSTCNACAECSAKTGHHSALCCFDRSAMTLTPLVSVAECRKWCASHTQPWAVKCTWMAKCDGCLECSGACGLSGGVWFVQNDAGRKGCVQSCARI